MPTMMTSTEDHVNGMGMEEASGGSCEPFVGDDGAAPFKGQHRQHVDEEDNALWFGLPPRTVVFKLASGSLALVLFVVVLAAPMPLPRAQQNCLAVLLFVCELWVTETMPLWATALCVPLLVVICDASRAKDGSRNSASEAAAAQLATLSDTNVILLMGGFTLASALHKYEIDVRAARRIQGLVGGRAPSLFILANMVVGFLLSMFCNNVAAPVVAFFLVTPVLHRVDDLDRDYCRCLVMGIAFACNIGGMPTPIASPQNAQALKVIGDVLDGDVSFLTWMRFALPVCLILLPACWVWLLIWWRPTLLMLPPTYEAVPMSDLDGEAYAGACACASAAAPPAALRPWSSRHSVVLAVFVATVALFCCFDLVADIFGSLGIVGLVPVVCLYGLGVLETQDFKSMDWSILMLLGGGASLGSAVQSSGLLTSFGHCLLAGLQTAGISAFSQFVAFNLAIILIANFISHTVAAIALLGVMGEVGRATGRGRAFVLAGVLCDSGACGLPVSSFPNTLAYGVIDSSGRRYLSASDFAVPAAVLELMCLVVVATFGWALADVVPDAAAAVLP